jgi:hypothetical protein
MRQRRHWAQMASVICKLQLVRVQIAQLWQSADKILRAAAGNCMMGMQCCQTRQPAQFLRCNARLLMHALISTQTPSMHH